MRPASGKLNLYQKWTFQQANASKGTKQIRQEMAEKEEMEG